MSDTFSQILIISRELFSQKSFDAVSVKDIMNVLNLSKASLYKHFENKDEIKNVLYEQLENDYSQIFSQFLAKDFSGFQLNQISELLITYFQSYFEFWTNVPENVQSYNMLLINKFSDNQSQELFSKYFFFDPVNFLNKILLHIKSLKINSNLNENNLSITLFSQIIFLINNPEISESNSKYIEKLINSFVSDNYENKDISPEPQKRTSKGLLQLAQELNTLNN